jgi:hypothetical protein
MITDPAASGALAEAILNASGAHSAVVAARPAGGAALAEVVGATAGALVATAALLLLAQRHRSGRGQALRRAADWAARQTGLPGWSALPSLLATLALITALFGMYWDISLHIDDGRDAGPLANPAHYFILVGLFGIFAAGVIAVALPDERPSRVAVKLAPDWYAPLGGLVLLATSSFALAGFPLDDGWHRLFGQDVTLWGPTHLMLIGGAGLTLLGHAILQVEAGAELALTGQAAGSRLLGFVARTRLAGVCGGLLIGLSTFQGEFDFGVPQFRLVFQPVLIAFAAGVALVAARIYAGRGGALVAVAYFWVIRGAVSLLVGPVLGETLPHLPLYAAEALVVELVALRVATDRPYRFGALAGLGIGTVGLAAEWGWSQFAMPNPWPGALLGEALALVPLTAVAAGIVGGFVGSALAMPIGPHRVGVPRLAPAAGAMLAIVAVVAYGLQVDNERGVRAQLVSSQPRGPEREVTVTARLDPRDAGQDADWLQAIAWQGRAKLVLEPLERVGDGVYRTPEPVPTGGTWKTLVRLHRDSSLLSVPVYLPEDPAIPAKGVPLRRNVTRELVYDHELLQRERKKDVPTALPAIAYGIVGMIAVGFVAVLGWALARLARGFAPEPIRR